MKTTFKLFFAALITLAAFSSQAQCGGPFSTRFESLVLSAFRIPHFMACPAPGVSATAPRFMIQTLLFR